MTADIRGSAEGKPGSNVASSRRRLSPDRDTPWSPMAPSWQTAAASREIGLGRGDFGGSPPPTSRALCTLRRDSCQRPCCRSTLPVTHPLLPFCPFPFLVRGLALSAPLFLFSVPNCPSPIPRSLFPVTGSRFLARVSRPLLSFPDLRLPTPPEPVPTRYGLSRPGTGSSISRGTARETSRETSLSAGLAARVKCLRAGSGQAAEGPDGKFRGRRGRSAGRQVP